MRVSVNIMNKVAEISILHICSSHSFSYQLEQSYELFAVEVGNSWVGGPGTLLFRSIDMTATAIMN